MVGHWRHKMEAIYQNRQCWGSSVTSLLLAMQEWNKSYNRWFSEHTFQVVEQSNWSLRWPKKEWCRLRHHQRQKPPVKDHSASLRPAKRRLKSYALEPDAVAAAASPQEEPQSLVACQSCPSPDMDAGKMASGRTLISKMLCKKRSSRDR